jgi:hypothetical protein
LWDIDALEVTGMRKKNEKKEKKIKDYGLKRYD